MQVKIYKRGQGKHIRWGTAGAIGVLAALGCNSLYGVLSRLRDKGDYGVWLQAIIPAILLAVALYGVYRLVNGVRFADFLIKTEGEMKKVSWTSAKDVVTSTKVVLITVASMAILLYGIDLLLVKLFQATSILN